MKDNIPPSESAANNSESDGTEPPTPQPVDTAAPNPEAVAGTVNNVNDAPPTPIESPPPKETAGAARNGKESKGPTKPSKPATDYDAKAQSFTRFRMAQNFDETAGVSQMLVHVSRLKPAPQAWFRVHPDEGYRMPVALLTLKDEKSEPYLVAPELVEHLAAEVVPHVLTTYVTRQKVVGLWPLRLPRGDGKTDAWMRTSHEGAKAAVKSWVRMTANMAAGAYDVHVTSAPLAEPEWPSVTFEKLVEIAYRDHIIESLDHPVLRRLRGEV